jgi:hypothetical protein
MPSKRTHVSFQTFFEKNLDALLGVRFLASEFATTNGGRNASPSITSLAQGIPLVLLFGLPYRKTRLRTEEGLRFFGSLASYVPKFV